MRLWPEVEFGEIKLDAVSHDDLYSSKKRFVPYNKGGEFRRWWGNQCYVIGYDREYDQLMDSFSGHRHDNKSTYFMPSVSWSKVSSGALAMRLFPQGFVYDVAGCSAFASPEHLPFLLALFNTSFSLTCMEFMSPTLNFEVGTLENFPVLEGLFSNRRIKELTDRCIAIAKQDWDSFEESWGFEKHPLL